MPRPGARAIIRLAQAGLTVFAIVKETGYTADYCRSVLHAAGIQPKLARPVMNKVRRVRAAKRLGQRLAQSLPARSAVGSYHPSVQAGNRGDVVLAAPTIVGGLSRDPARLIGHLVRTALTAPPIAPVTIRKADGTVETQDVATFRRTHNRWARRRA